MWKTYWYSKNEEIFRLTAEYTTMLRSVNSVSNFIYSMDVREDVLWLIIGKI